MIAAFLLDRQVDSIINIALPLIHSEKHAYRDSFTQYVEALFEEFDFDKAVNIAKEMGKEAANDILLKDFAEEIQKQATFLIFEVKCKIHRSISMK